MRRCSICYRRAPRVWGRFVLGHWTCGYIGCIDVVCSWRAAEAEAAEEAKNKRERLYPNLDAVAAFLESLDHTTLPDAHQRRKAAVARYVAELSNPELSSCRRDWREFSGSAPLKQ